MADKTVVHLIFKLDVGGLENVMLNCIEGTQNNFNHVVIALTETTDFAQKLPENVSVFSLNKKAGNDLGVHYKLYKRLKKIHPAIIHTYNIATIEYHLVAWLAGVKGHIHAEHGRDIYDPKGVNKKHNFLRRLMSYFIQSYIAVSADLVEWLVSYVGVNKKKVKLIYNGVDTIKFSNVDEAPHNVLSFNEDSFVFGAISRLTPIKDHQNLIKAFALLKAKKIITVDNAKLILVGDGPLDVELKQLVKSLDLQESVCFLGQRDDINNILRELDVYVMSSIAEGIPLAILEAMSTGLPIVSTAVGGIPELLENNKQGLLVAPQNSEELAKAMLWMLENKDKAIAQGKLNQHIAKTKFSLPVMVDLYLREYQRVMGIDPR